MKVNEEHIMSFNPDFDEGNEISVEVDLTKKVEQIQVMVRIDDYTIDQAKQIVGCLNAAIKLAEGNL